MLKLIKNNWKSFAKDSTIHGVHFIAGENRNKLTRIFWVISFICATTTFFFHVHRSYEKWQIKPDIVMRKHQKFIGEIPFPALTICMPFCENEFLHQLDHEIIKSCSYKDQYISCKKLFNRVPTDHGFCYSFNMQGFGTIFNTEVINDDFKFYRRKEISKSPLFSDNSSYDFKDDDNATKEWSLDQGFSAKHKKDEIPVAAQKGLKFSFYIHLIEQDAKKLCPALFNYYFHLPNEILTPLHRKQFIPFGQKKFVSLSARAYKTNQGLRKLEPNARDCYFDGEKKTKFFKSYTRKNCEFECMTNYTLRKCGCVKFSMPRDKINTPVCEMNQRTCYTKAMNEWPKFNRTLKKATETCDCFDTCTNIKYKVNYEEVSEESLDRHISLKDHGVAENDTFSMLIFAFGDHFIIEEEDYAPYVLQNFVADTGGLLGLFIGCSILSLIEILYFTASTISIIFKRIKNPELDENEVKVNVIDVKPTTIKM